MGLELPVMYENNPNILIFFFNNFGSPSTHNIAQAIYTTILSISVDILCWVSQYFVNYLINYQQISIFILSARYLLADSSVCSQSCSAR